jgi:protein-tyrosine phosphatase
MFYNGTMTHIYRNVYIGDWASSVDKKLLIKNGIKKIICLNTKAKPRIALKTYDDWNIDHIYIHIKDDPNSDIGKFFGICNRLINENVEKGEAVLVHCTAGISRSSSIVIAWLMWLTSKPYRQILNYVQSKRTIVQPNIGFSHQLNQYHSIL